MVDHFFLFLEKGVRPRRSSVNDGGYAGLQGQIRWNAERSKLRARISGEQSSEGRNFVIRRVGSEPIERCASVPNVVVDVDQAWRDVKT